MRYKLLGRSGLRVSELCLGTMTFGETWGWGASKAESKKMFDLFTKAGGNFIDTSINYTDGTSEEFLGDFLKTNRDYFVVATKYTLTKPDNTDPNGGGGKTGRAGACADARGGTVQAGRGRSGDGVIRGGARGGDHG